MGSSKPIKDFSQLKYLLATGNTPDEPRVKHTGNWTLFYGSVILCYNEKYSVCQIALKDAKMLGKLYPDKTKFSIKPHK